MYVIKHGATPLIPGPTTFASLRSNAKTTKSLKTRAPFRANIMQTFEAVEREGALPDYIMIRNLILIHIGRYTFRPSVHPSRSHTLTRLSWRTRRCCWIWRREGEKSLYN